ncbi:MAG: PepSY-associated TM helix domain-containing protein [Mariniphaga sp.]|nr:PepSY-associated TM helix domain-containing protein [Mariniphaga sp.]MDD4225791.1 PepSY-associated TM helix domain-containing protein [Mariniphaga sp.]
MSLRKTLRILHRDLGYFIVGMTFVYTLSGIFLNHRYDFNPDYTIIVENFQSGIRSETRIDEDVIRKELKMLDHQVVYKKHYMTNRGNLKIFIENGEVVIDPSTGSGTLNYLQRRPFIFEMNMLHRAAIGSVWKWVSDGMAIILFFVAVSGLFLLKGKRSFSRWGLWWTIAGIVIPLFFLLYYI